jgi:TolB protein
MSMEPLGPGPASLGSGRFSSFDRTVLAAAAIAVALTGVLIWRGDQTGGAAAASTVPQAGNTPQVIAPHILFTTVVAGAEQLFALAWQPGADGSTGSSRPADEEAAPAQPAAITSGSGSVWDYAPSPDGSRIVYSALNTDGGSDLWVTQVDGAGPALLLACPQAFCATPAWSPDGRLLAYSQRNANEFAAAAVSPPRLFLLDVTTQETAPVFADSQKLGFEPRWAADGQWLAYLAPDFYGVTAYNVETGVEQFYPTQTGETATWHPTRSEFLMTEQAQIGDMFVVHLYLVDPVANTRRNLSGDANLVEDGSPAWSPDGEWVAFRRSELAGERKTLSKQLWLMRADGSEAHPLTADAEIDYGAPAWSGDGSTLLFHRFPLKGPNIVISVWTMDLESGEQREVARPGQRPQWQK